MLSITLICVGTLREKYFHDAAVEYEKRLGAYCKFRTVELEPTADTTDAAMAKKILAVMPPRACCTALCVEGKQCSSPALAAQLCELQNRGYSELVFLIGGSDGLPDSVKAACQNRLSFSLMTFPHQLMRVILLEQLYRACNIAHGGKYHK